MVINLQKKKMHEAVFSLIKQKRLTLPQINIKI